MSRLSRLTQVGILQIRRRPYSPHTRGKGERTTEQGERLAGPGTGEDLAKRVAIHR